jgi:uncharacterized membrane protein
MNEKKEKIDIYVSNILLIGSYSAAVLSLIGLLMLLFFTRTTSVQLESKPLSLSLFFSYLKERNPLSFLNLGILVMMLTPLFRVMTAALSFFLEKDYKYVLIACGVLIILLVSIIPLFT